MCNANNHPPFCECGWGGSGSESNLGKSSAKSPGVYLGKKLISIVLQKNQTGPLTYYQHSGSDICKKSKCSYCGSEVYFIKHNDGCAFFDSLGYPWPKHECDGVRAHLRDHLLFSASERHNIFFSYDKMGRVLKIYKHGIYMQYLILLTNKKLIFVEARLKDAIFSYNDLVLVREKKGVVNLIKINGASSIVKNVDQKNIGTPVRSYKDKLRDTQIFDLIKIDHHYSGYIYEITRNHFFIRIENLEAMVKARRPKKCPVVIFNVSKNKIKSYVEVKITSKLSDANGVHLTGEILNFD